METGSYRSRASSVHSVRPSRAQSLQQNRQRPILTAKSSDSAPSDLEVGESASNVPEEAQQEPLRPEGLQTDVKISGKGIASAGGFKYFYDCSCSVCKRFWRETFGEAATELLALSAQERTALISPILRLGDQYVKCGDRVKVWGRFQGVIKFIGPLDDKLIAPEIFIGVKLDDNVNALTNGIYNGKQYFSCPKGHGVLVKVQYVEPLPPKPAKPPLTGNAMFPSYEQIKRRRKLLANRNTAMANLSGAQRGDSTRSQARALMEKMANGVRVDADPNDVVYRDAKKLYEEWRVEREKEMAMSDTKQFRNTRLQHWYQAFGGDNRAATMISTLKSLYAGQDEGAEIQRKEREREMKGSLASIEGAGGDGGAPSAPASAPAPPPQPSSTPGPQPSASQQPSHSSGGQQNPPTQPTAAGALAKRISPLGVSGALAKRTSPPGGMRSSPSAQFGPHRGSMKLAVSAFKNPGGKSGDGGK